MFHPWRKRRTMPGGSILSFSPVMRVHTLVSGALPHLGRSRHLKADDSGPDKTREMTGEKRDLERVPLEEPVKGEVMVFQPMTILNISLGGARIETSFPLQVDSLHDFRLSLGERSVVVKGRIAHCQIGELTDVAAVYRSGVEFVGMSEHARATIADFMTVHKFADAERRTVDGVVEDEQ